MRRNLKAANNRHTLPLLTGILLLFPEVLQAQGISSFELMHSEAAAEIMAGQGEDGKPVKCGFPALIAAASEQRAAIPAMQRVRPPLINPQTYLSPGGDFMLHYTLDGLDAVSAEDLNDNSIPDYIETAAVTLDSIRAGYRQRGWRDPVDDGDGYYDVYFEDLEDLPWGAWFGYTFPVEPSTLTPPYTSASYIGLENDYPESVYGHSPLASLRVTIAHEYHHAIQLAYNLPLIESEIDHYIWFAELSATYHEDIFYDGINDYYNYLDAFLGAPHLSLTETRGNHMYGAALWAIFLDEVFGPDSNRSLWTLMANDALRPLEAHRSFLADHGNSLLKSYRQMTIWQLHTGDRASGYYFPEGSGYPSVKIDTLSFDSVDITLPALACRYYEVTPTTLTGGTALMLHPSQGSEWGAGIAGELSGGSVSGLATSILDTSAAAQGTSVELYDWTDYTTVFEWAFTGDNVDTASGLSVEQSARIEAAHSERLTMQAFENAVLELHQNYPNPFRPEEHNETYFAFYLSEPAPVDLEIRSLSGRRLWSYHLEAQGRGGHLYMGDFGIGWDGRDSSGRYVPSGVYLMIARARGVTKAGKLSVIR